MVECCESDIGDKEVNTLINKEHCELKKYSLFRRDENKRVYKLKLSGVLFANNVKVNLSFNKNRNSLTYLDTPREI